MQKLTVKKKTLENSSVVLFVADALVVVLLVTIVLIVLVVEVAATVSFSASVVVFVFVAVVVAVCLRSFVCFFSLLLVLLFLLYNKTLNNRSQAS